MTDVLPYELPLIFSNDNLYEYLQNLDPNKLTYWEEYSIDKLFNKRIEQTEPFNYVIYKNDTSTRLISLVHPLSQLYMLKVIEKYDLEIVNHLRQNAIFSVRYPHIISNKYISSFDSISKRMLSILNDENEESTTYPNSYFVKRKFTKINHFYKSNLLRNLEIKYSKLLKLDFQNCFYNIYTHSLDWSYLGDIKLAKELRNSLRVSSILDKVMQSSNYGETNGIVVGPEFSRYIAEFVLCEIDKTIYHELKNSKIIHKVDYEIVRFMDDIFIFCNEDTHAIHIKEVIERICFRYRLSINESKSKLEERPFLKSNLWESKLRLKLVNFSNMLIEKSGENYKVIENVIQELTDEIKSLLINFSSEQHKIIGYSLKFFENKIDYIIKQISNKEESIRRFTLAKLIDLFQYILIFSINTPNILKYIKLTLFLYLNENEKSEDITDLLYKKALEILKFHSRKRIEVLNLFICLKFISKDLPESLLLKFLKEYDDYFTLATISFYLGTEDRKYKYLKVRKLINQAIDKKIRSIFENDITNKNYIKKILLSKEFYLIFDFYTSEVLFKDTKDNLTKFKNIVDNINIDWSEKNLYNFFLDFIKGFNKPFINWHAGIKDIVEVLDRKSAKLDTRASD